MTIRLYDPRGTRRSAATDVASRPPHLQGMRVGLLDNAKEQANVMLERIAARLREVGATDIGARKASFSHVAEPATLDLLRECGAVVTALGG